MPEYSGEEGNLDSCRQSTSVGSYFGASSARRDGRPHLHRSRRGLASRRRRRRRLRRRSRGGHRRRRRRQGERGRHGGRRGHGHRRNRRRRGRRRSDILGRRERSDDVVRQRVRRRHGRGRDRDRGRIAAQLLLFRWRRDGAVVILTIITRNVVVPRALLRRRRRPGGGSTSPVVVGVLVGRVDLLVGVLCVKQPVSRVRETTRRDNLIYALGRTNFEALDLTESSSSAALSSFALIGFDCSISCASRSSWSPTNSPPV